MEIQYRMVTEVTSEILKISTIEYSKCINQLKCGGKTDTQRLRV